MHSASLFLFTSPPYPLTSRERNDTPILCPPTEFFGKPDPRSCIQVTPICLEPRGRQGLSALFCRSRHAELGNNTAFVNFTTKYLEVYF